MTYRNLTIISTILAGSFGLGFLLIPQPLASLYSLNFTPDATFIARLLGAELIGYGLLAWFLRNAALPQTVKLSYWHFSSPIHSASSSISRLKRCPSSELPWMRSSSLKLF